MISRASNLLLILVIAYLSFGMLLYFLQRYFLYFPTEAISHKYDELTLSHNGVEIKVTVLNKGMEKAVIYFGGNAENVDYNAPALSTALPDHTIYLVKYRGYGGSTGRPDEKGIYLDAIFIFDRIKQKHKYISVIGRSLGSAVATLLASKRNINKLVLITPFDSVQAIVTQLYPIYPISFMLIDKYDSLNRVKFINAKTLIIIAENDKVINIKHTNRLVKEFPISQVRVEMLKNANHSSISNYEEYYILLRQFI